MRYKSYKKYQEKKRMISGKKVVGIDPMHQGKIYGWYGEVVGADMCVCPDNKKQTQKKRAHTQVRPYAPLQKNGCGFDVAYL